MIADPFDCLWELDQKIKHQQQCHQQRYKPQLNWSGIAFGCGKYPLIMALDKVLEIIPCHQLVPLPYARRWLKGLALHRGELLAITDLQDFILGEPTVLDHSAKILISQYEKEPIGLLVSNVCALHRSAAQNKHPLSAKWQPLFAPYIKETLNDKDKQWFILETENLVTQPSFYQVDIAQ
jgi:chemotaxis signal transduction protein